MKQEKNGAAEILKRIFPVILIAAAIFAVIVSDTPEKQQARAEAEQREDLKAALSGKYPMTVSAFSLDTFCTLTIYAGGGSEALANGVSLLSDYDELFNQSKEQSDIYRINHRTEQEVPISPETAELLQLAKTISAASGGDFDVTVGQLTALWNFKNTENRTSIPSEDEIRAALASCDPDGFSIVFRNDAEENLTEGKSPAENGTAENHTAGSDTQQAYFSSDNEKLQIDVGAIAKGYIADKLKEQMLADGVTSAIINLGGNVLCIGEQPEGEPFVIGLKKTDKNSQQEIAKLAIDDLSVVTAGIYERYFELNGVHYHHILSTRDGYPVQNGLSAVTVVGPRSAVCDALSTTLFIKGKEAGQEFLETCNAELLSRTSGPQAEGAGPYYAYFISRDGAEVSATPGAEQLELR